MIIAYDSRTGNVQRFIEKLDIKIYETLKELASDTESNVKAIKITEDLILNEDFILITYTTGHGQASKTTLNFLEKNHSKITGVASSGNKNWGDNYCQSAEIISHMYNIPILYKFELSGTNEDIEYFKTRVIKFETHRVEQRSNSSWGRWFLQIRKR